MVVGVVQKIDPIASALIRSLKEGSRIHDYTLRQGAINAGGEVTATYRVRTGLDTDTAEATYDTYIGVRIGPRVFVYKADFGEGPAERHWIPVNFFALSILEFNGQGQAASLQDKFNYFVNAKYDEPLAISAIQGSIANAEFIFNFIPTYGGLTQIQNSQSGGQTFMGVVKVVGDVATLGLGSKIQIAHKVYGTVVVTAAVVRVGDAASNLANGTATVAHGVDALLATVEAGLASVTFVKVKIKGATATVNNLDEAKALAPKLNRTAEDVAAKGLTRSELRAVTGLDLPAGGAGSTVPHRLNPAAPKTTPGQVAANDIAKFKGTDGKESLMPGIKVAEAEKGCVKTNPSAMPLEDWLKTNAKDGNLPDAGDILWILQDNGTVIVAREVQGGMKLGHPTLASYGKTLKAGEIPEAKMGGEIVKVDGKWTLNNKSGRYSSRGDIAADDLGPVKDLFSRNGIDLDITFLQMAGP